MSNPILNGDKIYIDYNGQYVYCDPTNPKGAFPFTNDYKYSTPMTIIKVKITNIKQGLCTQYNECGTFTACDAGEKIYYGNLVYFWVNQQGNNLNENNNQLNGLPFDSNGHGGAMSFGSAASMSKNDYIVGVNSCEPAVNGGIEMNPSDSNGLCGFDQDENGNQNASRGLFAIVREDGTGLYGVQHLCDASLSTSTTTQVNYGDKFTLQAIFEACCLTVEADTCFTCIDTKNDQPNYNGIYNMVGSWSVNSFDCRSVFGSCTPLPSPSDNPEYYLNFVQACSYTDVCSGSCNYAPNPSSAKYLNYKPVNKSTDYSLLIWLIIIIILVMFFIIVFHLRSDSIR